MNKIDSFSITEMTISGFKNFTEPRTFCFGDMTSITGHCGLGQTTIAEAIAYAITGVPFFGEAGLDRLYTMESRDMSVALTLETTDGATHQLIRTRRNDDTSITFDGYTVRQNELITMFGEKEVFLSIFNPLYFIEILGDKGRNLLERYLPTIPHDAIMAKLSESTRELIKDMDLSAPENMLEYLRAEIRAAEKSITYTEGQRDLLGAQTIEGLAVLNEKKTELSDTQAEINTLVAKKTTGFDFDAMREQLTDLYARRDEAQRDLCDRPDMSAFDAKISDTEQELNRLRAQVYVSAFTEQFATENANFELVKTRYKREKTMLDSISIGNQCPVCKQTVTAENIGAIKKSFSDSIDALIQRGNALRERIAELSVSDTAARTEFEQQTQSSITGYEIHLSDLITSYNDKIQEDKDAGDIAVVEYGRKIQSLEENLKYGGLDPAEQWELEGLEKEAAKLTAELATLEAPPTVTSAEKDAELAELTRTVEKNKVLQAAVKLYLDERTQLMFKDFDKLNRVKLVLYEVAKTTGEVKSVFKFSFDGKPYTFLSLSERTKAGLEVSALIKRLTERDYPVFIDNGESVPVIDNIRPTGQVFVAQVVKGAELEVRDLSAPAVQNAA